MPRPLVAPVHPRGPPLRAGLAQVVVAPRYQTVKSFATVTLTALVDEKPDPAVTWSFPGRAELQAPGGVLSAPEVSEPTIIPVLATRGDRFGEGALLVLPHTAQTASLFQAMGAGLTARWSNRLPFLDVETGKRFGEPCLVRAQPAEVHEVHTVLGYGMPVAVSFPEKMLSADALLLTYRAGVNVEREEVTGQRSAALTLRDNLHSCQLEGLWRRPLWHRKGTPIQYFWESRTAALTGLTVRGVVPLRDTLGQELLRPKDPRGHGQMRRKPPLQARPTWRRR